MVLSVTKQKPVYDTQLIFEIAATHSFPEVFEFPGCGGVDAGVVSGEGPVHQTHLGLHLQYHTHM